MTDHCQRLRIPAAAFRLVWDRQQGRCLCGADLSVVPFHKHHEPPLGLRPPNADANDPNHLELLCVSCHERRTPMDIKAIAKAKRIGLKTAEHLLRMSEKEPGRSAYQKTGSIRSRGFETRGQGKV